MPEMISAMALPASWPGNHACIKAETLFNQGRATATPVEFTTMVFELTDATVSTSLSCEPSRGRLKLT